MEKTDQLLLSSINDKLQYCQSRDTLSFTAFLDPRQCMLAESEFKFAKKLLYGGYEDAERRIAIFLPDYMDSLAPEDDPLCILRLSFAKGSRELTHRDYLGALLSLGVDRSISGDIIVRKNGADIIILKSMSDFLLDNFSRAGKTNLSAEILPLAELDLGEIRTEEKRDTVASLRLDSVLASAFNLARGKAQDAISSGSVFVNSMQSTKPDREVQEGDKIVLRGRGKAVLSEVGGSTRKGRISIVLTRFL